MKYLIFIFIIIFNLNSLIFCQQKEKPRILIFDFDKKGNVTEEEVSTLSEKFKTRIIDSKYFEVISRDQLDKLIAENKLSATGFSTDSSEDAVAIGNLLNSKLAIVGNVSFAFKKYNIAVKLINLNTGKNIIAKERSADEGNVEAIFSAVYQLADEMILAARVNLGIMDDKDKVNISDIRKYIDVGIFGKKDYQKAWELYQVYLAQNGETIEGKKLEIEIKKGLGEEKYNMANDLYKKGMYNEAKIYIEQAISYDNTNSKYRELLKNINDKLEYTKNIWVIESAKDDYEKAKELNNSGYSLEEKIRNTEKAREYIKSAIEKDPKNKTYANLAREIENNLSNLREQKRRKDEADRYWYNRKRNMDHGGFGIHYSLFNFENTFINQLFGDELHGFGFCLDAGDELIVWYNRCNIAIKGVKWENYSLPSYLGYYENIYLHISTGLRFHIMLFTILDLYAQAGVSCLNLFEKAKSRDGTIESKDYHYAFGFEYGGGFRIMITPKFGFYAEIMQSFNSKNDVNLNHINLNIGIKL